MLDIESKTESKAKCYFAHTVLPHFIDNQQPPTKRKPFSTINAQAFNHTLDLIVPFASAGRVKDAIKKTAGNLQYAKVHMKLSDVLSGDFFNHYIKTGNIILLSEGRPGIDNTFSLASGILTISLDKPTYERAGLQGRPTTDPGRKHVKSRFEISLNLRLPSMVKGRKGFDRALWAAQNVFTDSMTWLFYDLRSPESQASGPIKEFQPFIRDVDVVETRMANTVVPAFPSGFSADDEVSIEEATELLEWISLACLDSPRIRQGDCIDSFLSRYSVPSLGDADDEPKAMDLVKFSWHGFMPAERVAKVMMASVAASKDEWFAVQVGGFHGKNHVVLKVDGRALTWECE